MDTKISVRLTVDQHADLMGQAKYLDRSPSWCVRQAVEMWLRAQEKGSPGHLPIRGAEGGLMGETEPSEARQRLDNPPEGTLVPLPLTTGQAVHTLIDADNVLSAEETAAYHEKVQKMRAEKQATCDHPPSRRIGKACAACGKEGVK